VTTQCDVLVVGGGPVGLLLGALLAQAGVDVRVIEKRAHRTQHSRAIGVHPPGLSCLQEIGVAEELVRAGVKVRRGRAVMGGDSLGVVDFSLLPAPFDFVLSVPQSETERLLEQRLAGLSANALTRGAEAIAYVSDRDRVTVRLRVGGRESELCARYVVGCDGRRSSVRRAMNTNYAGRAYPDRFAMADAPDDTSLGSEAVVFVDAHGLVESFPLPDGARRWVLSLGKRAPDASPEHFTESVRVRTGQALRSRGMGQINGFVAERFCAGNFVRDRLILAGDAAHVVSPIGGQGMNLGWLDARALARTLTSSLATQGSDAAALAHYARERKRVSVRAARRAEVYMALGLSAPLCLRAWSLRALTSRPVLAQATRFFTMQGLES
jgi:2-polyprenyl-6-methoxyphenol hydroxylase-like FAD-dependent oxidoreductase